MIQPWIIPKECKVHWNRVLHGMRIEREMQKKRVVYNPTILLLLHPEAKNSLHARKLHSRPVNSSDIRRIEQESRYGRSK